MNIDEFFIYFSFINSLLVVIIFSSTSLKNGKTKFDFMGSLLFLLSSANSARLVDFKKLLFSLIV